MVIHYLDRYAPDGDAWVIDSREVVVDWTETTRLERPA